MTHLRTIAVGFPARLFALGLLGIVAGAAQGQTWGLLPAPATLVLLPTSARYVLNCTGRPPPCCQEAIACGPNLGLTAKYIDIFGWNRWWDSIAPCKAPPSGCGFMKARGQSTVRLKGLGSSSALIRWDAFAYTKERCNNAPGSYIGEAKAAIAATIGLAIAPAPGVAPGTPVTVYFRWRQASTNSFSPEAGLDDAPTSITGGTLGITGGGTLFDLIFDLVNTKGGKWGPDVYGSFVTTVGSTVAVATDVKLISTIADPAIPVPCPGFGQQQNCRCEYDRELVSWGGEIELSLGSAVPPPMGGYVGDGEPEPTPAMLFSVDIGGDAEIMDPSPDGNEVFDPGDAYAWMGPPMLPPGADGILDDALMFVGGFDPTPNPGVPYPIAACLNTDPPLPAYFDLDDIDVLDAPLSAFIPPAAPLAVPIPRFASSFIHRLEFSAISFEDDGPERFVTSFSLPIPPFFYCSVPVGSTGGGAFARTYGKSATEDEIELMTWTPGDSLPYVAGVTAPGLDEESIHVNLAPNPDFTDTTDDDVDAIDILPSGSDPLAAFTYFTVDHEAPGPFVVPIICGPADPPGACFSPGGGIVYQFAPGGPPTPVIIPSIHLGLPYTIDIRALEFVWLTEGAAPESLAMVFSVAPDDPGTFGIDESGGLNPALLYYSFLTGTSAELIALPFDSPVDAFSNYRRALLSDPVVPPSCCVGDADGDGDRDFADITATLANWGVICPLGPCIGNSDCDGDRDFADITATLANWAVPCP